MATRANLKRLKLRGIIDDVSTELDPGERAERGLYITPLCISWLNQYLPTMETSVCCDATPSEQADALIYRFISGKQLHFRREIGDLNPLDQGIWELKCPDLRFFGWFPCFNIFLIAFCNDASRVKQHNLYRGYMDQCVRVREGLDLDPPKFVEGGLVDVISD